MVNYLRTVLERILMWRTLLGMRRYSRVDPDEARKIGEEIQERLRRVKEKRG